MYLGIQIERQRHKYVDGYKKDDDRWIDHIYICIYIIGRSMIDDRWTLDR